MIQRFMRPLVIVFPAKAIEDALLSREIEPCGACRFGFERAVHSLVPPILLRMAGLDPFRDDAELDPPDR